MLILFSVDRFFLKQCADIFGALQDAQFVRSSVDETNGEYGGLQYAGSRVMLPNGSIDPWHALGVTTNTENTTDVRAIFIEGTAHCADMYPSSEGDSAALVLARQQIYAQLAVWVKSARPNGGSASEGRPNGGSASEGRPRGAPASERRPSRAHNLL